MKRRRKCRDVSAKASMSELLDHKTGVVERYVPMPGVAAPELFASAANNYRAWQDRIDAELEGRVIVYE